MGAVEEFARILKSLTSKIGRDIGMSHYGVIFDHSRSAKRLELFPGYKAHRPPIEESLRDQIPAMKAEAESYAATLQIPGYEADDILATYARLAEREGMECVLVTQDKDLHQCVTGMVSLFNPVPDVITNDFGDVLEYRYKAIGIPDVIERWGVSPRQVVDILAIWGDASDGIKGIEGIGEKGAKALIAAMGTLENVLADPDLAATFVPRAKKSLPETIRLCADQARLAYQLVDLSEPAPVPHPIDFFEIA